MTRDEKVKSLRQQAEEQLGFKFNMPQCDEVTKMINERGDQEAKADAGKAEIRLEEKSDDTDETVRNRQRRREGYL